MAVSVAAGLVAMATTVMPATAAAGVTPAITGCPTGSNDHCWAEGTMGMDNPSHPAPVWLNQLGADLEVACLRVANPSVDLANFEMWMDTNDNVPGSYTWVEMGLHDGVDMAGINEGFTWFWADARPTGNDYDGLLNYHEHFSGMPAGVTNTYDGARFRWGGHGAWSVLWNGTVVGVSTNNGDWAGGGALGAESSTQQAAIDGGARNWEYADTHWVWQPVQPQVQIINGNGWLQATATPSTPGAFVDAWSQGFCGNAAARRDRPALAPAIAVHPAAVLAGIARHAAAAAGDRRPAQISYVKTTRHLAQAATGADVAGSAASYLVVLRGSFTGRDASVPPGGGWPRGHVMTLTVNATTGMVTDVSVGKTSPLLSSLGPVTTIP